MPQKYSFLSFNTKKSSQITYDFIFFVTLRLFDICLAINFIYLALLTPC